MPTVITTKSVKAVKNLGWILRHASDIKTLGFNPTDDFTGGQFWAKLHDGTLYLTDFASLEVFWQWVNRPVLRGLTLSVSDPEFCRKKFFLVGVGSFLTVGNPVSKWFQKEFC